LPQGFGDGKGTENMNDLYKEYVRSSEPPSGSKRSCYGI